MDALGSPRGARVSLRRLSSFSLSRFRRRWRRYTRCHRSRVFLPVGNHFHLRSATTTPPRHRVKRELSNKLFPPRPSSFPLSFVSSIYLLRALLGFSSLLLAEHVLQTASTPKKNTQRREACRTVVRFQHPPRKHQEPGAKEAARSASLPFFQPRASILLPSRMAL